MADLDKIIARLEEELDLARITAAKIKKAAGKNWSKERSGATKSIYNLLERIAGLEILKVAPKTKVLYDVEIWGFDIVINGKSYNRIPVTEVQGLEQRFIDLFQIADLQGMGMGIELKSESTTIKSIKGGLSKKEIEATFRLKTSIQKQIRKENKILGFARKNGLNIILKGRDVVTGLFHEIIIDPDNIHATRIISYRKLPDKILPAPLPLPDPAKPKLKKKPIPKAKTPQKAKVKPKAAPQPKPKVAAKTPTGKPAPQPKKNRQTQGGRPSAKSRGTTNGKPVSVKAAPKTSTPKTPTDAVSPVKPTASSIIDVDDIKSTLKPAVEPVAESAPVAKPQTGAAPKPRFKIGAKLKFGAGLIINLGFDLLFGWLHSRDVKKAIENLEPEIKKGAESLLAQPNIQEEIYKFRSGNDLQSGYTHYFKINLLVHIDYHEYGVAGQEKFADITKIEFKSIEIVRVEGKNDFPDTRDNPSKFEDKPLVESVFYTPVYQDGERITPPAEDAADGKFNTFIATFINRSGGIGDYSKAYFDEFRKYAILIPDSAASDLYNLKFGLNEELADLTLVELRYKHPKILMATPHNMDFEEVIKKVRWGLAIKVDFIFYFYNEVIYLDYNSQIYYLEKYDKYFRLLDDAYIKCNSSCHRRIADRRLIHRITANDVREKMQSEKQFYDRMRGLDRGVLNNSGQFKRFIQGKSSK